MPPSYQPTKPASNKQNAFDPLASPALVRSFAPAPRSKTRGRASLAPPPLRLNQRKQCAQSWEQMRCYTAWGALPLRYATCRGFVRFAHFRTPAPRSPPHSRGQFVASLPPPLWGRLPPLRASPLGFALRAWGGRASGVASHLLERARTFSASAPLAPLRPIARQFGRAVAQTRGFAPQTVRSTRPPFWLAGAKRRIVARFAPVRYHFAATSEITKPLTAQKKGRIVWTHSQRFKCEKPRRLQSTGLF